MLESYRSDDEFYFSQLHDACLTNDPLAALESLVLWLGVWCTGPSSNSVKHLAGKLGDDQLAKQILALRELTSSESSDWVGTDLFQAVDRARRRLLEGSHFSE